MAATVRSMQGEGRCELCGARDDGAFRSRIAHLRKEHPAYARGLILRLAAPGLFLVVMLALAAARAPQWGYLVALVACFGLLFFGKSRLDADALVPRRTLNSLREDEAWIREQIS